jgi:hypothetical protein
MLTRVRNNLLICIVGQGFIIGAMTQAVKLPVLIIFAIGLGLMFGSVFREIAKVQNQLDHKTTS